MAVVHCPAAFLALTAQGSCSTYGRETLGTPGDLDDFALTQSR